MNRAVSARSLNIVNIFIPHFFLLPDIAAATDLVVLPPQYWSLSSWSTSSLAVQKRQNTPWKIKQKKNRKKQKKRPSNSQSNQFNSAFLRLLPARSSPVLLLHLQIDSSSKSLSHLSRDQGQRGRGQKGGIHSNA